MPFYIPIFKSPSPSRPRALQLHQTASSRTLHLNKRSLIFSSPSSIIRRFFAATMFDFLGFDTPSVHCRSGNISWRSPFRIYLRFVCKASFQISVHSLISPEPSYNRDFFSIDYDSVALWLIMVIGLSGVQFGLLSYKWLTKSDDREAGVRFVNHECDYRLN